MSSILVLLFVCAMVLAVSTALNQLEEKFWWKTIDFEFDSEETRDRAIKSAEFVPRNNVPFGIEIWREKLFVTIPRRNPGVPSTLNYVLLSK